MGREKEEGKGGIGRKEKVREEGKGIKEGK